ncbi:MAG: glutamate--cysteine ligase [Legionella sp.]|nr:MAG: glutamate--cysteine ligase [Legionella sp.]
MINPVPHLTTAQSGPLFPVEALIIKEVTAIESWFRQSWEKTPAPLMSSVDLRHEGFKLAPVDTNLFPAGFNNLNPDFMSLCVQAVQSTLNTSCQKILLLPEHHTRNQFYLQSLSVLRDILLQAGYGVRIGQFNAELTTPIEVPVLDGEPLLLEPAIRQGSRIGLVDYDPCLVILNNDLSSGVPDILQGLEQRVEPNPQLGWSSRLKSVHFSHYDDVVREFSALIGLDPWLINPIFSAVEDVDFMAQTGVDRLSTEVDVILQRIREQYRQFGIQEKPYVVVKADNGTYGMGVMMVHDAAEILHLNRKKRTKMAKSKGNQTVSHVMIQEGVYSFETMADGAVAEPVVYMMGQYVVGGFYRVHRELGTNDILNTPGMHFEPLAFAQACNMPSKRRDVVHEHNRFYAYGVIARLAALAAAREAAALTLRKTA